MGLEPEAAADSGEAAEKPASADAEVKDGLSILTAASFEKAVSTGRIICVFSCRKCSNKIFGHLFFNVLTNITFSYNIHNNLKQTFIIYLPISL